MMLTFFRKLPTWFWLLGSEVALIALAVARFSSGDRGPVTWLIVAAALWLGTSVFVDSLLRVFRTSAGRRARVLWLVAAVFLAWNVYRLLQGWLGPSGWNYLAGFILTMLVLFAAVRAAGRFGWYGHGRVAVVLGAIAVTRIAEESYNLTTGLLLIGAMAFAALFASDRLSSRLKLEREAQVSLRLMWSAVFLLIVLLEFVLRFGLSERVTYMEANNGGTYVSLRGSVPLQGLFTYAGNQQVTLVKPEFVHSRRANSLGLPEQEIGPRTDPQEYRIVALGDSFTEGVGAPYESTWVKRMEAVLAARMPQRRFVTINAGISGSDVCFQYKLLEEKLLALDPQLVIVALNTSDVVDLSMRGGMERFLPDGTVRPIAGPWWEWLYGVSYITRHVVHDILGYNWFLIRTSEEPAVQREAVRKIRDVLGAFAALADRQGFTFLVVLHPHQADALAGKYPSPLDELAPSLSTMPGIHQADLIPYFRDDVGLTAANAAEFYWPIDFHHTAKGYDVMGRAIAEAVVAQGLIR